MCTNPFRVQSAAARCGSAGGGRAGTRCAGAPAAAIRKHLYVPAFLGGSVRGTADTREGVAAEAAPQGKES